MYNDSDSFALKTNFFDQLHTNPEEIASEFKYYYLTWCHGVIYVISFIIVYVILYINSHEENIVKYLIILIISSPFFGWSTFGILSLGHDAAHGTVAPQLNRMGGKVNDIVSWLCLDCFFMSTAEWKITHYQHDHKPSGGIPSHYQSFCGSIVFTYDTLCQDLKRISQRNMQSVFILLGMIFRYGIWIKLGILPFISNNISTTLWMQILFNTPHQQPNFIPNKHWDINDIKILRTTWDILPTNNWINFACCGLNSHLSHHLFPNLPRSLYPQISNWLTIKYANEYRVCSNYKQWLQLIRSLFNN